MTTTLKFLLLFAISNVYSQSNEYLANSIEESEALISKTSINESQSGAKYSYLGLTINAPDPNKIYLVDEVENKPSFPGNQLALKTFLKENFKTPINYDGAKVSGTIFASFVVEKDGSISEIGVLNDYGYGSGEEAIRVLSQMPKWIAGKNDSIPVRCSYFIPIVCNGE